MTLPDVYLEMQHPCWSCNSSSSSANADAGMLGRTQARRRIMDNDDYTAKMTELIRLMRAIGNDTQ